MDVASGVEVRASGAMVAYLAARTRFFDEAVLGAIERGVTQIVVVAAGYDGRSLRYGTPAVTFFELDHPATQADKLERLARLGIDAGHVRFVAADFVTDDVARALVDAGFDLTSPTLFTCEGVAVYLELAVLESLLRALRTVASPLSTLVVSMSVAPSAPDAAARRARFKAAVARLGEPLRSDLDAAGVEALLTRTGWVSAPHGSPRAGLVTATPAEPSVVEAN